LQDKEDDAVIGVKSTALRFGEKSKIWVGAFYAVAGSAITIAGLQIKAGWVFLALMLMAVMHLSKQVTTLDPDNAQNCLTRFRSNAYFGGIVFAAFAVDVLWRNF
jgi:4-hydroxybenzoate polyprenyltransferase